MPRSRSAPRSGGARSRSYSTSARTSARPSAYSSARAPPKRTATSTPARGSSQKSAAPNSKQSTPAPQPMPQQAYYQPRSSFLGSVAEGFAFGAGSAVAHNAVNGVVNAVTGRNKNEAMDPNAPVPMEEEAAYQQEMADPCALQRVDFNNCLEMNKDNGISECQVFFDSFKRCQERASRENVPQYKYE